MLKIDIQICFTTIPAMQNFIEIYQRNPEVLSSGGFRPPRLDRGIERPRLDRVKGQGGGGHFDPSLLIQTPNIIKSHQKLNLKLEQ